MKKFCTLNTVFLTAGIIVVSLGLAACSDDDATGSTLTFTGANYGPHANQTIRVAVFSDPGGAEVARSSAVVPADGTFSFTFPGVLTLGTAYNLDYFADGAPGSGAAGGNGVCDPPPGEHAWRVAIPAVTGNVTVAELHNGATIVNVCASFP